MGVPRARRGGRKSARARRAADAATRARRARPPRVSFSRGTRRVWGWETHHTLPSRICVRVEAERDAATPTGAAAGALARRETARRSMTASRPARREVPCARARAHPNTANAHLEIRAERTNPRPAGLRVLAVEPTGIQESAQPPRSEWSGEVFLCLTRRALYGLRRRSLFASRSPPRASRHRPSLSHSTPSPRVVAPRPV